MSTDAARRAKPLGRLVRRRLADLGTLVPELVQERRQAAGGSGAGARPLPSPRTHHPDLTPVQIAQIPGGLSFD